MSSPPRSVLLAALVLGTAPVALDADGAPRPANTPQAIPHVNLPGVGPANQPVLELLGTVPAQNKAIFLG